MHQSHLLAAKSAGHLVLFIALEKNLYVTIIKGKSSYRGYDQNPAIQNFIFIFLNDNFNVSFSLHTLSCPKLKFGQLKAYKLMCALESSMKK